MYSFKKQQKHKISGISVKCSLQFILCLHIYGQRKISSKTFFSFSGQSACHSLSNVVVKTETRNFHLTFNIKFNIFSYVIGHHEQTAQQLEQDDLYTLGIQPQACLRRLLNSAFGVSITVLRAEEALLDVIYQYMINENQYCSDLQSINIFNPFLSLLSCTRKGQNYSPEKNSLGMNRAVGLFCLFFLLLLVFYSLAGIK